jgi:hypothetical protein
MVNFFMVRTYLFLQDWQRSSLPRRTFVVVRGKGGSMPSGGFLVYFASGEDNSGEAGAGGGVNEGR